jgi:hypothetical protein
VADAGRGDHREVSLVDALAVDLELGFERRERAARERTETSADPESRATTANAPAGTGPARVVELEETHADAVHEQEAEHGRRAVGRHRDRARADARAARRARGCASDSSGFPRAPSERAIVFTVPPQRRQDRRQRGPDRGRRAGA